MGFIDYHGTKKDRYPELVKIAKGRQTEERIKNNRFLSSEWLAETLGDERYRNLTLDTSIKYVLTAYKDLCVQRDIISEGADEQCIDPDILWQDLCITMITRHLESFNLPRDKKLIFYRTFMEKVFKFKHYTAPEKHYEHFYQDESYQRYINLCFDMVHEKQFWKWIGKLGYRNHQDLNPFVDTYKKLTVITGYYLFLGLKPDDLLWVKKIETEKKVLENLRHEYEIGRFKEPDYIKLRNPLYFCEYIDDRGYEENKQGVSESWKCTEHSHQHSESHSNADRCGNLDKKKFMEFLETGSIPAYIDACNLIRNCKISEKADGIFQELVIRLQILQESLDKFKEVYEPDMYQFNGYYIPEALQIALTYVEYLDAGIGINILEETEENVCEASKKLLLTVNEMIDEIYRFASIEVKARAKALESVMSRDGYVDPEYRM